MSKNIPTIDVSKLKVENNVKFYRKTNRPKNVELINLIDSMKEGQSVFIPLARDQYENIRMQVRTLCNCKVKTAGEPTGLRVWAGKKKKGGE